MEKIRYVIPLLLAAAILISVATIGQIKSVKACGLDDLTSCFSGSGSGAYAGQQDAIYDHNNGISYDPVAACCHSDEWDNQFRQGYDTQWNQYQSQTANVNVENSPGAVVNVGQTSNQNQGPSGNPCEYSCGSPIGPGCDFGCSNGPYFHHFGCGFNCGYGYRHIFWPGEDS